VNDPHNLRRFVEAQEGIYSSVVRELERGHKNGHWIWYIFPQISGLGRSETSRRYAISSLEEARAYLEHPTLGPRLRECTQRVMDIEGRTAEEIFGQTDAMKLRSCMTLFSQATQDNEVFVDALAKYFGGSVDPLTMQALESIG